MKTEEIIAKYPKIFAPYEGNPKNCNWYGVPKGWLPIIDDLCGCIQNYIDNFRQYIDGKKVVAEQVICIQMKEKFGRLRFYTNGHNDIIEGMINYAEYLCDNTCDRCSSREDLGMTTRWISVCCRKCAEKEERVEGKDWNKNVKPVVQQLQEYIDKRLEESENEKDN